MLRSLADWLGWERLSDTNRRHEELRKDHETIMAKLSELEGLIGEVATKTTKALGEVRGKIDELTATIAKLQEQLADTDLPAGAETRLAELKAIAQSLDDIVPDATA